MLTHYNLNVNRFFQLFSILKIIVRNPYKGTYNKKNQNETMQKQPISIAFRLFLLTLWI